MKIKLLLLAALTALVPGFTAISAEEPVLKPIYAEHIAIDGKLDDAVWKKAQFVSSFKIMNSDKPATRRTEVAVANNGVDIVFGFKCYIPANEIKNAKLFDECVEVMIDPQGDSASYYHFALGHNGELFDRACDQGGYVQDTTYESGFRGKVQHGKDFWTAEIAIPFRALDLASRNKDFWTVNCARESSEITAIGKNGVLNVKGVFVKMLPPQANLEQYAWKAGEPVINANIKKGKLAADYQIDLTATSGKAGSITPELMWKDSDGKCYTRTLLKQKVDANSKVTIKFPAEMLEKSGKYSVTLNVRDAATHRLLVDKKVMKNLEFVPIAIDLIDPHYRQAIFVTQKLDKVRFKVTASDVKKGVSIRGSIRKAGEKSSLAAAKKPAAAGVLFEFDAAALPMGRLEAVAEIVDASGKVTARTVTPIRKLEYRKGEVWRGKDRNWYIDGKKVFLLLSWNNRDFYFPEFLAVMTNTGKYSNVRSMTPMGFGLVANGFGLRNVLAKQGITPAAEAFFRKRVAKYMQPENVFAHYWVDEPDCSGLSRESAAKVAAIAADVDPWHPVVISTGTKGVIAYPDCGEINGFHCYPHPSQTAQMSNFKKIVVCLDIAAEYFKDKVDAQSIAYLHQGFNYGEHGSRRSRVPSYEEYRSQNLLALILGAQGLLHYNVFQGDYPEILLGMPLLVKEQKVVGEEAIIQTPLKTQSPTKSLRLRAAKNPETGAVWLLACNVEYEDAEYEFELPEFGNSKLQVLSENRSIKASNGRIKDKFRPFEVHVYTTDMRDFKLKTVDEIKAVIEDAYKKLAKPGNILWQRMEEEKLEIIPSSNAKRRPRDPIANQLWHVTDGVIKARSYRGGCPWQDNTPNEVPDWIELKLKKAATIGRVVVYPENQSLRDFEVQLKKGSADWKTVGKAENSKQDMYEFKFTPEEADAIRIYVTKNNGKHTIIAEIEAYEK
ncbi:MAG: discoidin domain-containing protein [Lentisphaeria bacterium]|nr:discoidin domain-containing protein [Lentisphaeria bacterium]